MKNTNNSVIFSKYGDIVIDNQNVNLNGLVYAPFGNVEITAQNLNLNNVVIIADTITFNCPSVNANYSESMAELTGTASEPLNIPYEEWKYLPDSDEDILLDLIEIEIGTDPHNSDTAGDELPDGYEILVTYTDPVKPDSDNNDINNGDEDFDEDSLTNLEEYILTTDPWNEDSDGDGLEDNDEIYLGTDPTNPDTDGNGILDGDEKFYQTFTHIVENEDCAVEEVIVSMEGTGNLQRNTTVESMMNIDMLSTNVAGLVGEPFEIESEATFDKATISFKIDQSKLGETAFDNLLFLWYDEENDEYVELETIYDEEDSIVSIETTHFSRYMVVDKYQWFEAWSKELNYTSISYEKSICYSVLAVDCSGSMKTYDPITIIPPSSAPYRAINSCERQKAVSGLTSSLYNDDKAAIVTFESNDLDLEAKWCYVENGICAEGHWFEEGTRARRIRDMLKDDIPAIISVGPGDGIKAYDIDTSSKVPAYTDANQSISNHYFTITAVIDDKIKQKNGDYDAVMYEVSTWGQKYYISEKEIRDYISTHSSLFTNVLYIEEK